MHGDRRAARPGAVSDVQQPHHGRRHGRRGQGVIMTSAFLEFPAGFVWGTATSAYQIEGGWDADGKGESIWDRFAADPAHIADGCDARIACDHYHRFVKDLDLMSALGL